MSGDRSRLAAVQAMANDTQLSRSEKMAIEILLSGLKPLTKLPNSITLPFAAAFLLVALDEGRIISSYARRLGVTRFIMSRYIQTLGERARNGGPGLGLVAVKQHPIVPNARQVYLTAKGRSLAKVIFWQMRKDDSTQL